MKEVVGLQPYEKRIVELLKIGGEKRALKYAKKKVWRTLRPNPCFSPLGSVAVLQARRGVGVLRTLGRYLLPVSHCTLVKEEMA